MGLFRFDEHSIVEGKKKKKKNVERSTSSIPEAFSFIRRDKDGREISYRSSELQSSWKRWLAIKIGSAYLFVHAAAPISSILRSRLSIPGPFIERRSITVLPRTIPFGTVRISFFRFVPRVERGDKSSANRVRCFSRAFLALFSSLPFFRQFYSTRACHHHRLPPPSSSTPGVSLAWIYIATVRIYRETCSNAVLFFQRDPFSLFRPLYGYYAVIYRTVERSTRLAPRIDFNKNIYRILSREVLYEYSLYVYIYIFLFEISFSYSLTKRLTCSRWIIRWEENNFFFSESRIVLILVLVSTSFWILSLMSGGRGGSYFSDCPSCTRRPFRIIGKKIGGKKFDDGLSKGVSSSSAIY